MKFSLKAETKRDVLLHIGLILALATILLLAFFYLYLPYVTNHNQTVSVPDLKGKDITELEEFLNERDLDYIISDSSYNPLGKPLAVIQQFPEAGAIVKKGRKIYLTINSKNPPQIKMPKLVGKDVKNAQNELLSYGLLVGQIKYIPDLQAGIVLRQFFNGQEIEEGITIAKGSKIDLEVADGVGNTEFEVPNLIGKSIEEADIVVSGINISIGSRVYDETSTELPGTIIKQKPEVAPENKIKAGEVIDIWIAGPEPEQSSEIGE